MIVPLILAGGAGTRLWPESRALLPKQFIEFPGQDETLFQATLTRLDGLELSSDPIIICNDEHRFLVAEQLRQLDLGRADILLEPVGRNTAPAVAIAALHALSEGQDSILLVLPADHAIKDVDAFQRAVGAGLQLAKKGRLVTFGIVPDVPETGYGYIYKGEEIDREKNNLLIESQVFEVESFVEKPDLETAKAYLASGDYLWNSGMFMFRASDYLNELKGFAPEILDCCQEAFGLIRSDADFHRIPADVFKRCPSDSIDYAVMENTYRAAVVPLDVGWNDLGAWSAVWDVSSKSADGNVVSGDVMLQDVRNSYIQASSRLVAAVGLKDMIIVETSDAVLVATRNHVQDVKQIVDRLKADKRPEYQHHDLVYRPWGSYESLANEEGYQVKHIVVDPGQALSLQMHRHRAEHWTIVHGTARVTRDDEVHDLGPNESIFLPLGCRHRLENPGQEPVELIEVQVGDYLGEDDIVRFEDVYGRARRG